jgi:hypothetical protein
MKNIVILFVVFAFFPVAAICQKSIPPNVKKEFSMKFPSVQNVKWSSEEENEWEAEFKINVSII